MEIGAGAIILGGIEIGANAMLVRVGALYHDIGKMKNATYYLKKKKLEKI